MPALLSSFTEILAIDSRTMSGNVLLPLSTEIPQRIITIKDLHGNANISSITIKTQGSDIFDTGLTQSMLSNSYDSRTFYACSTGCWYLISQAVTPLSLTLSNNLFVGNTTVLSNTLTVGGTAAFSNTTSFGGTGTFSNNVGVLGTLNVGKAAVLSNTLQVNGNIGIGTSPSPSYAVYANGDLVVFSAGSMGLINPGTSLRISASNASGSAPANIVLNGSGGNVGIGVANPAHTLDILGSLRVSGNILGVLGQTSAYNVNAWYSSVDTVARFYFGNNGPTYFGTGNGEYYWRQTINSGLNNMSLDNNGNLSVRGNLTVGGATPTSAMSITGDINCSGRLFGLLGGNLSISTYSWEPRIFVNNWWYCSAEGKPRIYCLENSCTYFGSGDGTFRFQNAARNRDNVVIDNVGNLSITGSFYGNGANLTVGSANYATYAASAGSAPLTNAPLYLYNMALYSKRSVLVSTYSWSSVGYWDWLGGAHNISYYTNYNYDTLAMGIYSDSGVNLLFGVSDVNGTVYNKSGSYAQLSDSNLKENISKARDYTEDLCRLNVVKFNFKDPSFVPVVSTLRYNKEFLDTSGNVIIDSTMSITVSTSLEKNLGLIAQEVYEVFPGLVTSVSLKSEDGTYTSSLTVKTSVLVPMIITSIQGLCGKISTQQSLIEMLLSKTGYVFP